MIAIFLDFDGVLNRHKRHANGVCGLDLECVDHLNWILAEYPHCKVVVSSAWRYYVHNGFMTLEGFELMLQTHGLNCHGRIHGITRIDDVPDDLRGVAPQNLTDEHRRQWHEIGLRDRAQQIREYAAEHGITRFVVLDDLPLEVPNLVQTNPDAGLTLEKVYQVTQLLEGRR